MDKITLVIHGGAGTISQSMPSSKKHEIHQHLTVALQQGYQVLVDGGSAQDAVVASIVVLEDCTSFNAGCGSVLTHEGNIAMDASIMRGSDKQAGSICGVRCIKNPISLARDIMEQSDHIMLMQEGAEKFAFELGYEAMEKEYFITKQRKNQLLTALKGDNLSHLSESIDGNLFYYSISYII
eukprot:TRINITY_DN1516_c0_g1_i1.p1 TRINITY_DN1516_c0_g1~~TRINITY_DN1516_c0_g1_i1.p1  ORF type:complete len:182 (-),score=44.03 TRINITY_DN1516_c0_g1_i1:461-1006(-)